MFVLILPFCFFVTDALPFMFSDAFKDCPNIPAQENLRTEQIAGSWRLAYLFYDEQSDIQEDGTCVVSEFTPVGQTLLRIAVHMDFRPENFVIDRTSFDVSASYHTPEEWLLHSSSSHKGFFHVRVISLTKHHMILTFCITNITDTENFIHDETLGYNYILQKLRNDKMEKFIMRKDTKFDQENPLDDDLRVLFGRSFIRRRSIPDAFANTKELNMSNEQIQSEKHFWTLILTKDNDVSAFNFVENASVLMKLGFDVTNGTLFSFGKCNL